MDRRSFTTLAACAGLSGATGAALVSAPVAASSDREPVRGVLELFTSQGCSSCPAADALFERFTKRTDLVALTLPVDYWDYLGWKDTLANHKFTKRQREYARLRGDGQIYTPQLVVNGNAHTNGTDAAAIEALVTKETGARAAWAPVEAKAVNGHLVVAVGASPAASSGARFNATVWVASVSRRMDVIVKRGENAGKTLSYFNVVRDVSAVGMWNGTANEFRLPRESLAQKGGEDAFAVVLQHGMAGPLYGAGLVNVG